MTLKKFRVELNVDGRTSQKSSAWHGTAASKVHLTTMEVTKKLTVLLNLNLVSKKLGNMYPLQ